MPANNNHIKLRLLWENGKRCAICGRKIKSFEDLSVDHIVPLSRKGQRTINNCQLAHKWCNSMKSDYMPDEFERMLRYNRKRIVKMRIWRMIMFW